MSDYNTRSLTVEESNKLLRALTITLGGPMAAGAALRAIASVGAGVFMAEEVVR